MIAIYAVFYTKIIEVALNMEHWSIMLKARSKR